MAEEQTAAPESTAPAPPQSREQVMAAVKEKLSQPEPEPTPVEGADAAPEPPKTKAQEIRERLAADRQRRAEKLAQNAEPQPVPTASAEQAALEMLKTDPARLVDFVKQHGGEKFDNEYVNRLMSDGGKPGQELRGEIEQIQEELKQTRERAERLEAERDADKEKQSNEASERALNDYLDSFVSELRGSDEFAHFGAMYEDAEFRQVAYATMDAIARQNDLEKPLPASEGLVMIADEWDMRLKRMAGNDAGRKYLIGLLGIEESSPEQPPQPSPGNATPPKSISSDMSQRTPSERGPKTRRELIRQAVERHWQA